MCYICIDIYHAPTNPRTYRTLIQLLMGAQGSIAVVNLVKASGQALQVTQD